MEDNPSSTKTRIIIITISEAHLAVLTAALTFMVCALILW